jgi:hypothetical protein
MSLFQGEFEGMERADSELLENDRSSDGPGQQSRMSCGLAHSSFA